METHSIAAYSEEMARRVSLRMVVASAVFATLVVLSTVLVGYLHDRNRWTPGCFLVARDNAHNGRLTSFPAEQSCARLKAEANTDCAPNRPPATRIVCQPEPAKGSYIPRDVKH